MAVTVVTSLGVIALWLLLSRGGCSTTGVIHMRWSGARASLDVSHGVHWCGIGVCASSGDMLSIVDAQQEFA